ncbi:hypothetical protein O6H91_16G058200 [Diphasiastrum complanatum]|uniref:Uncharacterized protein n=1 Tax=Diphasiastrum complanatum TaxID=34168 RepID=A0ACC2BCJ6_DIPCM|nr:hypothetical protein O6H91_16G058200 [Diphasiastrum complanatum]
MASQKFAKLCSLSDFGWMLWLLICLVYPIILVESAHEMEVVNTTVDPRLTNSAKFKNIHKHLSTLNKPAVMSIESPDGDIIDCVARHQQIAFDHLLLKNHKLQTEGPSVWPVNKAANASGSQRIQQLWHQNGRCPENTVPVRRTTVADVLRSGSKRRYGRKPRASLIEIPLPQAQPVSSASHEHAIAYAIGNQYYGARASINVWKPTINMPYEFSLSQIWLLAGSFDGDLNTIEAGWQVSPELYGDTSPRLFTYWTSDAYQTTGCYDLGCSGFIQLTNDLAIGAAISPVSSLGGSQFDIQILIWKDLATSNWWMLLGDNTLVGYWPKELFTHLTVAANMVQWGGEIVNTNPSGHHTSTQMGSGQFPSGGFERASYFRNLAYVDASYQLLPQINLHAQAEHPNCYGIKLSYNTAWGNYFFYGGPGLNANCP